MRFVLVAPFIFSTLITDGFGDKGTLLLLSAGRTWIVSLWSCGGKRESGIWARSGLFCSCSVAGENTFALAKSERFCVRLDDFYIVMWYCFTCCFLSTCDISSIVALGTIWLRLGAKPVLVFGSWLFNRLKRFQKMSTDSDILCVQIIGWRSDDFGFDWLIWLNIGNLCILLIGSIFNHTGCVKNALILSHTLCE